MNKTVFNVDITRAHITDARRQDARRCPIAAAIVASDPDIVWANVTHHQIRIGRASNERIETYRAPKAAREFITDFDNGRRPKPFRLVVTDDAFVSIRPRQMHQRETAIQVEERRTIARSTGRKLAEVAPEETSVFDSSGWAVAKTARERVIRPSQPRSEPKAQAQAQPKAKAQAQAQAQPQPRSRPKAAAEPKRPYARRETSAEVFAKISTTRGEA